MTITHRHLAGSPAVDINQIGCNTATFVSIGRLPFGSRQVDVRLVTGVAFAGYWEAAKAALEEVTK